MMKSFVGVGVAVLLAAAPVQAQDVQEILGGIAKQYIGQEQDKAAFAQAQQQNTVAAYRAYIQQFPNGAYVANARAQVRALGGSTRTDAERATDNEATAAAGSNLTAQQRREVQRRLTGLGYDTSGTDGSFGPGTRRAIALWQRDRNYSQTGTLSTAQANELLSGRGATSTGKGNTANVAPSADAQAASAARTEANIGLTAAQRSAVQQGLTNRGFNTRGVDGSFGPGTRAAITGWQRANDITPTGYLTVEQVNRLLR